MPDQPYIPDDETAKAICKRYASLYSDQSIWRSYWQDVADYFLPRKSDIVRRRPEGSRQNEWLFDGSGERAAMRLAANLHGSLTSMAFPWFNWILDDETLRDDNANAQWTEQCTKVGYDAFNATICNFGLQMPELYLDLDVFGTACMLFDGVLENDGRFRHFAFKTLQIGTYVIDENPFGKVDTVIRRFDMSARNAAARFGEDNLGKTVKDALQPKKNPDQKFPFIHAVMPTVDFQRYGGKNNLTISSVYIDYKDNKIVDTRGYRTFPYIVPRWFTTSGEAYGRSPAMQCLPDTKTLNKGKELKLEAWALAVRPPLKCSDDGVIGEVDWSPAGLTVVRQNGIFEPMMQGSDFKVAEIEENNIRQDVREAFFYDDLNLPSGRQMTAEEVLQRIQLMQRLLGPIYGRLQGEAVGPLTDRAWDILFNAGKLPPPPEDLSEANIAVRYEGPLARAQRGVQVDSIVKTRTVAQQMAETGAPEALEYLDASEEIKIVADVLGYPKKAMRSDDDVAKRMQAKQQAEMAKQVAGAVQPVSQGIKNLADVAMNGQQKTKVPGVPDLAAP